MNLKPVLLAWLVLSLWVIGGHIWMSAQLNPLEERFVQTVEASPEEADIEGDLLDITRERDELVRKSGFWRTGGWYSSSGPGFKRTASLEAIYLKKPW